MTSRITQVFAVYDRVGEYFHVPFFVDHPGLAIRSFTDAVNSGKESDLSLHPDDYELFHIGEYDSSEGVLTPHTIDKPLVLGSQVLRQMQIPLNS